MWASRLNAHGAGQRANKAGDRMALSPWCARFFERAVGKRIRAPYYIARGSSRNVHQSGRDPSLRIFLRESGVLRLLAAALLSGEIWGGWDFFFYGEGVGWIGGDGWILRRSRYMDSWVVGWLYRVGRGH